MDAPERITRVQGKRWLIELEWADDAGDPIDLTGASVRMQLRATWADDEPGVDPLLDLTEGAGLTVSPLLGSIVAEAPDTATVGIPAGVHVCEVEVDFGGGPERLTLLEVEVLPEVVRVEEPSV